jgi:ElaA protein
VQLIDWRWQRLAEFSPQDLYQMLALRQRIFVIEQRCIYLDADGVDAITEHLTGHDGDKLVACLRLLPPHVKGPEAAIGRVAVARQYRRQGLGRELMRHAMQHLREQHRDPTAHLAAQAHLVGFYGEFGFDPISEPYDEDGIAHVDMRRVTA